MADTLISNSLSVGPLIYLFQDHIAKKKTLPPTAWSHRYMGIRDY
jgi:hypothetical protein